MAGKRWWEGIWADELKLCIVCAGGRIDGWVGGKGAFLNLCVPFFFLGAARGWYDRVRKISKQPKEREELIN